MVALGVFVIAVVGTILYFVFKDDGEKVKKPTDPVPPDAPKSDWVEESFPLDLGMYGSNIRKVQVALGFPAGTCGNCADGRLGDYTKNEIVSAGYTFPLSQVDYNALVKESVGENAYASKDGVKVYNKNGSVYKTAKKDEWLLKVAGKKGVYTDKWITAFYDSGDKFVDENEVYLD